MQFPIRIECLAQLLILFLVMTTTIGQSEDRSTPTVLPHPAMFGKRWTPSTTVQLYTVSWDLYNETTGEPDYLDMILDVGSTGRWQYCRSKTLWSSLVFRSF